MNVKRNTAKTALVAASVLTITLPGFCREVSSDTVGLVQFISNQGAISRKGEATPGQLYATRFSDPASNQVASLSIGTPDGERIPIADPYALRRRTAEHIDYPDFYIETGEGQRLIDAKRVRVFENVVIPAKGGSPQQPDVPDVVVTRTFKIKPLNSRFLMTSHVKKHESSYMPSSLMNDNFGSVTATPLDGEIFVECEFRNRSNSDPITVNYCDVEVEDLIAVSGWQNKNSVIDDFSENIFDYYFKDNYEQGRLGWSSTFSLGRIRTWVDTNYGGKYHIENWANYEATNTLNLAGNGIRFTKNSLITTYSDVNPNDTQVWRCGGAARVALRVNGGGSSDADEDKFDIIEIDFNSNGDFDYIWTSTTTHGGTAISNVYALTCYDLKPVQWYRPEGQTTTLTTLNGTPAYCITIPKDTSTNRRFYKAGADAGIESDAYMFTELPFFAGGGVAIKDTAGKWRKLVIDGSTGAVSSQLIPTSEIPSGVDEY